MLAQYIGKLKNLLLWEGGSFRQSFVLLTAVCRHKTRSILSTFPSRDFSFWRILNLSVLQGVIFSVLVTNDVQKFLKVWEIDSICVFSGPLVPSRPKDSAGGRYDAGGVRKEENNKIFKDTLVISTFETRQLCYASEDLFLIWSALI